MHECHVCNRNTTFLFTTGSYIAALNIIYHMYSNLTYLHRLY